MEAANLRNFLEQNVEAERSKSWFLSANGFFLPIFTETIGLNLELCIILNAWSF